MITGLTHFLNNLFVLSILAFTIQSCSNSDDGVLCTEEFRTITIQVEKDENQTPLTAFYTLDLKTGDTIREGSFFENNYPVLSDSYQEKLENDEREFLFEGFINDEKVVSEIYLISADECHIDKVSGTEKVILD